MAPEVDAGAVPSRVGGEVVALPLRRGLPRVELDADERDALCELARGLPADVDDPEAFCTAAGNAARELPPVLAEALRTFKRSGSDEGALVVDAIPSLKGPCVARDEERAGVPLPARVQAIVDQAIGETVAFASIGGGRLFHELPSACTPDGGSVSLETERCRADVRPDVVSIAWLRAAPGATVEVLAARRLTGALARAERAVLSSPRPTGSIAASWSRAGVVFRGELLPYALLEGSHDDPLICLDPARVAELARDQHGLESRLATLIARHRVVHRPAPGELLLIDNRRAIAGYGPTGRDANEPPLALRAFIVADLLRSRDLRPGDGRVVVDGRPAAQLHPVDG